MLFAAGMIDRQGKVEAGNTVTDFDPEENKRTISISAATAPVEWKGTKINVIDVPGYFDFIGEMMGPLRVVETAAIVVGAVSGLTVGAEVDYLFTGGLMAGLGVEYTIVDIVSLRGGFHYGDPAKAVPMYASVGLGVKFAGVHLDAAFLTASQTLGNTLMIGLGYAF